MQTVGPIWRETVKNLKNGKYTLLNGNMARKLKNVENETQTLYWLEYGKKHWKTWKMRNIPCKTCVRNAQCRTWNMARKQKKRGKWDTNTVWPGTWQGTLTNLENEKCTLYNPEYGEKYDKRGKWEMHTVGPGMWRKTLKKCGNWKTHTVDLEYVEEHWKNWKMKNVHCRTWIMARNLKNGEIKTQTLYVRKHGHKYWKTWKILIAHFWTSIMARKLRNVENERETR